MSTWTYCNFSFRGWVVLFAFVGLGLPLATQANEAMVASCHELVLDQEDAEKFAGLFTVNGSLSVMGQTVVGHEAIAARLANQDGPTLRHMMTNIRITPVDATRATGVSYALIYGGAKSTGPIMVANFTAMGEYFDEYEYADTGCRFSQRKFVATFLPRPPTSSTNANTAK
jgi:hypothetical protein